MTFLITALIGLFILLVSCVFAAALMDAEGEFGPRERPKSRKGPDLSASRG